MTPSYFNEALNGHLFILLAYTFVIFTRFIWYQRHLKWDEIKPATAVAMMIFGDAMVRGIYWWTRQQVNLGEDSPLYYSMATAAAMVQTVGIVMIIQAFSPEDCGPKSWIWALILAATWTWGWMYLDLIF